MNHQRVVTFNGKAGIPLPFEVVAATEEDRAIAAGLASFLSTSLNRLYPNPKEFCLHNVPSILGLTEKLALSGTIYVEEGKIALRGEIRELSQNSLADFTVSPVLRTLDVTASRENLADLYEVFPRAIEKALEIEFQGSDWSEWQNDKPRNVAAFWSYVAGLGALENDDSESAIASFGEAIRSDPSYTAAASGLGDAYRAKWATVPQDTSWRDHATNAYRRALGLDERSFTARLGLGDLAYRSGETQEALDRYTSALAVRPLDYRARTQLAQVYELAGQADEVERVGKEMTGSRPNCYRGYNYLAGIYAKHARYLESERELMKAIALTPWNARAYHNLALVQLKQGRYLEAIDVSAQGAKLPAAASLSFSNLGRAYLYQGCHADALVNLRHAVSIEPDYFAVWTNLGEAYSRIPGHDDDRRNALLQVEKLATEALQRDPGRITARSDLAVSLAGLGRPEEAMREISAALQMAPEGRDTLLQTAAVYELTGQREGALEMIEKALKGGLSVHEIEQSPWLDKLRAEPQYDAVLARADVSQDQRSGSTETTDFSCPNHAEPGLGLHDVQGGSRSAGTPHNSE